MYKTKLNLEDGEAYVIAPLEFWEHMIETYRTLAEDQKSPEYWLEAADFVSRWIATTLYVAPVEDDGWN
jgi:hypothetical protein